MNKEWWMNQGWMKDEEWMMMISSCLGVLDLDRQTEICECRVAFVSEKCWM